MSEIEPAGRALDGQSGGELLPGVQRRSTDSVGDVDNTPLAELEKISELLQAEARSDATRRAYAYDWARYRKWVESHGINGDTISPDRVRLFLVTEAHAGKSLATIERRLGSLSALARRSGHRSLYDDQALTDELAGIRVRAQQTGSQQRQATALTLERLAEVIPNIDTNTTAGKRDKALLLVGWTALLRPSEIAALRRDDIAVGTHTGWLDLTVRKSKGSNTPEVLAIGPLSKLTELCPVQATKAWLDFTDRFDSSSPLFPRITRGDRILAPHGARSGTMGRFITGDAVNNLVKKRTTSIATATDDYSGHSLRRGGATSRAQRGATTIQLERAGRWAPGSTEVRKYIEAANRAIDQGAHLLNQELPPIGEVLSSDNR